MWQRVLSGVIRQRWMENKTETEEVQVSSSRLCLHYGESHAQEKKEEELADRNVESPCVLLKPSSEPATTTKIITQIGVPSSTCMRSASELTPKTPGRCAPGHQVRMSGIRRHMGTAGAILNIKEGFTQEEGDHVVSGADAMD